MGKLILGLAMLAASFAAGEARAQAASEAQLKAAYLYQFGGFVDWPPEAFSGPQGAFRIGLIGAEAVADELQQVVATRQVHGRQVEVRRLRPGDSLEGLHVLFVGAGEGERLPEVLAAARGKPLLLVTESDDALALGSVINFVAVGNRVRFDVALDTAERSRLRISSRLLGVARRVVRG